MQLSLKRLFWAFTTVSSLAGCSVSHREFEGGMADPSQKGTYICENSALKAIVVFDTKDAAIVSDPFGTALRVTDLVTNSIVRMENNAGWSCGQLSSRK